MLLLLMLVLPLVAAGLAWILRTQTRLAGQINWVLALMTLAAALKLASDVAGGQAITALPGDILRADTLSALMAVLVSGVGFLAVWFGLPYLRREVADGHVRQRQVGQYTILLNLFLFTMLLAVLANNVGLMWVAIEGTTLATAFLVGFHRAATALEASWKYIIIGSVGIALAFIGTVLIYFGFVQSVGESESALNWTFLVALAPSLSPALLKLAFVFILVGYGTKAGLAPMHTWLPDAHSEAPAPISALMSGVLLSVAVYAILRFKIVVDAVVGPAFTSNLLLLLGSASVLIASFFMLTQWNYKRMLAYSSVEHIGLVSLGLGFGGPLGILGALLHIINHAAGKSLLFFLTGNILQKYGTTHIADVRGLARVMPWTGGLFVAGSLALLGVPPFSLFFSELLIFRAGFAADQPWLTGAIVALLVLVFAGFMSRMQHLLYGDTPENVVPGEVAPAGLWPLAINIGLLLVLGLTLPGPLARFLDQIVQLAS
jgi:hydrogenase-4 component F